MAKDLQPIVAAVRNGDRNCTVNLVREAISSGHSASDILADGLVPGMQQLGDLFKNGQAFLPEILISARAMNAGLEEIRPHLAGQPTSDTGTVVLGTVEGDLHDIGKKLVGMLLAGNGFDVIDLGVDVRAEAFVAAARQSNADVVALSSLLTTTLSGFRRVIESLEVSGLRDRVTVMVGGAPVTLALASEVGADGFAEDCVSAVEEAKRLVARKGRS